MYRCSSRLGHGPEGAASPRRDPRTVVLDDVLVSR